MKRIIIFISIIILMILIPHFNSKDNDVNLVSESRIYEASNNEVMDFPFRVSWSENGIGNYRPESVTYKLYNVLNENDVVSTITLTSANRDPRYSYLWNGTFKDVPKYNSNGSLANYYIVQDNLDNYTQQYNKIDIKSLCIEFGSNTEFTSPNSNRRFLAIQFYDQNNKAKFLGKNSQDPNYYLYDLRNKTVCVPVLNNNSKFNLLNPANLDIKRIYPSGEKSYYAIESTWITGISNYYYGEYYPKISSSSYSWSVTSSNFPNADIIINNLKYTNYYFDIEWDDEGFENERPNEVVINMYNENDLENVYKTSNLNITNTTGQNKWSGTFYNIPKYNDDGTEARYIIKPVENSNYTNSYDYKSAGAICIEFGENVFNKDPSKMIKIGSANGRIRNGNDGSSDFDYSELKNQTYCVSVSDNLRKLIMRGDIYNLDIKYIYPASSSGFVDYTSRQDIENIKKDYYNDDYPQNSDEDFISYTWEESKQSFPNANSIKFSYNKYNLIFDKYWEDENNTSLRPNQSTFYLYRKGDETNVLDSITLNNGNADPNDSTHWIGTFNNLSRFDENGNRIEYVVREKDIPNYITSFDSKEGLSIKFGDKNKFGYPSAASIYFRINNS